MLIVDEHYGRSLGPPPFAVSQMKTIVGRTSTRLHRRLGGFWWGRVTAIGTVALIGVVRMALAFRRFRALDVEPAKCSV
jgi:hypothetical protein